MTIGWIRRLIACRLMSTGVMLVAVILVAASQASALTYHNKQTGYSLTLPDGWVQIPDSMVKKLSKIVFKDGRLHYQAGFQAPGGGHWFSPPYVLIQSINYKLMGAPGEPDMPAMKSMVKQITGNKMTDIVRKTVKTDASSLLSGIKLGQVVFDPSARQFAFTASEIVAGVGKIHTSSMATFGREAITSVHYYTLESDWNHLIKQAQAIHSSFKFDSATKYDPSVAVSSSAPWTIHRVSKLMGSIAGGALLLALFVWLIRKAGGRSKE